MRMERSLASAELALLESAGFEFGIMRGLKSRGPKPHRMAQVLPELHARVTTPTLSKITARLSRSGFIVICGGHQPN